MAKRKRTSLWAIALACVLLLSACGKAAPAHTTASESSPPASAQSVPSGSESETIPVRQEDAPVNIDIGDGVIMTISVPEDTPVADSSGEIPGANGTSNVVREVVTFGSFYQDAEGNELRPIEWLVLDEQDGYTLLLTRQIIASMGWVNTGRDDITWAETDLRQWLDSEFYNTAFSEEEQANMALFNATQPQNPRYDTPAGEATVDYVSLLSYQPMPPLRAVI